jgi:hypothetical protein
MTTHKTTTHKATTHKTAAHETTAHANSTTAATTTAPATKAAATTAAATTPDIGSQAADALATLKQLTSALPIDDAIPPKDMSATRVIGRVPLEAMTIATGVIADAPAQFPQFDPVDAQGTIDYEQAMVPVAQAAQVLSSRITKSVLKRRTQLAQETLALYQVMKGTSRLPASEQTRTQVKQMSKLLSTRRKVRATEVSQTEADQMVKTRKTEKKAAVASTKLAAVAGEAALANAQVTLQAAANAGTLPPPPLPGATSPVAPAAAVPAAPAAPASAPAAVTPVVTASH